MVIIKEHLTMLFKHLTAVCCAQVTDLSGIPFVSRELMLVKVQCSAAQRAELTNLADIFHGNICDVSLTTVTLEVSGKEEKMQAIQTLLAPYGASPGTHAAGNGML